MSVIYRYSAVCLKITHLANLCNVSNHLLPRNNGQTKQFICRSRHCKGQGCEVRIIVMLLKATSFRVVNTSRKVNRTEFPTRKVVLTVFTATTECSISSFKRCLDLFWCGFSLCYDYKSSISLVFLLIFVLKLSTLDGNRGFRPASGYSLMLMMMIVSESGPSLIVDMHSVLCGVAVIVNGAVD